jgi:hypothetical protein
MPEELALELSMTPSDIEPATFRLVTQCLNQPRTLPFLRGLPVLLIPSVAVVAIPFGVLWFCIHVT